MTIQDLGAIGELVGGAAVIATLIYLAVQLKQNTQTIENSRRLAPVWRALRVTAGRRSFDEELDRLQTG